MLSNWINSLRITHISLALVGLMWVLPFLHFRHEYPLTTFDQECWSVILGLCAMFALLDKDYWQAPQVPRIVLFPLALIAIASLQMAMGKLAYVEQGLLYIFYLLFAAMLILLGAWLRRSFGIERLAVTLAVFLLTGAELSAAIGVLQHFQWSTWFDAVIVRKIASALYGNVAQPNHYANYITLGLISLGLLYQQQKLKPGYVTVLAIPLLFVLVLSGSRSSWFYLLMIATLSAWCGYKNVGLRPLLKYAIALLVGFALMHLFVQMPWVAGGDGDTDTVRRFVNSDTKGSIRLYLWHEAMLIFAQSPLLGVGFGQFAFHHFELQPELQPKNVLGLYNNAHNLVLQLAAETGIAGLLAFFATFSAWLYGMRRASLTVAHWWGYAALGVLGIHSLLEYPLWYTYFIAIFAFLLGMMDETHYRLAPGNIGRVSLAIIVLAGCALMVQLQVGYKQLKSVFTTPTASGSAAVAMRRTTDMLASVRNNLLLAPYAQLYISAYAEITPQHLKEKIDYNYGVLRFVPTAEVSYRHALLLAQDGQTEAAKRVMEQAIWSYPHNEGVRKLLSVLAEKDPAHFSALLEFATQKEQEHDRAVRNS